MTPRRSRLAALVLAAFALAARPAAAQTLIVDSVNGNAPNPDPINNPNGNYNYEAIYDGDAGTGEIDHSAGTVFVGINNSSSDAFFIGRNAGSHGTYDLSANAVLASSNFTDVGASGTGVVNQTGGTANFSRSVNGGLVVGANNGGVGTYNQSAGTVSSFDFYISDYPGSTGTYNLDGGTLATFAVDGGFHGGTNGTFNFNGGTLQSMGSTSSFISGLTHANVRNGGAVIDTHGNSTLIIPQTLSHSNVPGDAATDGGLTVGTSTTPGGVILTANNTYTGRTVVNSGALSANNTPARAGDSATGSGSVYVAPGASLGGNGSVGGNVFVGSVPVGQVPSSTGQGTLAPGDPLSFKPTATLTIKGNLTFQPGASMLEMDLDPAGTASDLVTVGGNLSIGGDLQLTLAAGFKPTALETFTLIDVTGNGTTTGTFENTTAGGTLYTDANGNVFLLDYAANADDGLLPNDVTATFLGVPEPSAWATTLLGACLLGAAIRRRVRRA